MEEMALVNNQITYVSSFETLVSAPFEGVVNAACWNRPLNGDFSEIIAQIEQTGTITDVSMDQLMNLPLSEAGTLAREMILNDFEDLKMHGASPVLNLIECYDEDDSFPFFPTDVYSFHVDRSPVPTDTFLCTYHGAPSDILPNEFAEQKIHIPSIRTELKKLYDGSDDGFEAFLSEYFFDLHYRAKQADAPISLGTGNLWRLAVDCPESTSLPCIHRAPKENDGQLRLLMIC